MLGIRLCPYDFDRTLEEQKGFYEKGASECDGITIRSNHQDWLAMDAFVVDEDNNPVWDGDAEAYEMLEKLAKKHNLKTGRAYGDANHTEYDKRSTF